MKANPNERGYQPTGYDWLWILGLVVAAIFIRLVPHPYNMTPVGALALFAGARLRTWAALAVPLVAMAVSDLLLLSLKSYVPFNPWVYGAFLVYVIVGWAVVRLSSPLRIGLSCIVCSILFFLISNFGAWINPLHQYPQTLQGLLTCYLAAIPFYSTDPVPLGFLSNTIVGDLFYTVLIFGVYALLHRGELASPVVSTTEIQG